MSSTTSLPKYCGYFVANFYLNCCFTAGSSRGFATFQALKSSAGPRGYTQLTQQGPPRRTSHSAANLARRGGPRQRVVGTAGVMAMSAFFFTVCLLQANATHTAGAMKSIFSIRGLNRQSGTDRATSFRFSPLLIPRGGDIDQRGDLLELPPTPPIEFAHGTTTLSFVFQGGIVAAVDSRASIGNFVGSKTTQKVLPVSR